MTDYQTNQFEIDQSDLEKIASEKEQIANRILNKLAKKGFNKENREKIISKEDSLYKKFTKICYDIAESYDIKLSFKDNKGLDTIDKVAEYIIKEDYNRQCLLAAEEAETIFGY